MAWSPDGAQLAISVTSIVLANPYNGFHVVDIRSGRDRQIFRCNDCLWQDLDWSPDGRTIAGVDDGRIIFIDAKSAETRYLWTNAALPNSSPSWSPDGRLIAFSAGIGRHAAVYVTDRTGHQLRRLAAGSDPSWSPRGGAIAYRAKCGVRLVGPTGRDVTPSTPFVCNAIRVGGAPVWSPDGRRIAVSGASYYGTGSAVRGTWVMHANGSALKLVSGAVGATFGGIQRPAWRPRP